MAREPVYRAGTNPGGTPAFSGADPAAFGAGVGRGLQALGETIERRGREDDAANAGVKMAEVTGAIDVYAQDQRGAAQPGGEGHVQSVLTELDKQAEAALGEIRDKRVRQVYRANYAELRARVQSRENAWEAGARVDNLVSGIDKTGTLYANQQATDPTPDGLEAALGNVETQVGLLELPKDAKDKIVREQQRKVVTAWGNAMVDRDHEALAQVIDAGVLNPYLEPEDIKALRSGVLVEGRRQEAAARAKRSAEEAAARESLALFNKRIEAGDLPSDAEFDQHAALAQQFDLKGQEFDVAVRRSEVHVNRETRDWTPAQFDQAINNLRAKGDKRTTAENVQLSQLEKIRGPRVTEFTNDPHGYAARIGRPAPGLNWDAPAQGEIDGRVTWARSYARSAGLVDVPYLSAEELRPLKERVEQGAAGKLEVSQQLRGRFGAGVGGEIARQLEPGDKTLQLLVGLPGVTANRYGLGIEAKKRNPALFDRTAALEEFQQYASAIPADLRTPVFDAASNIAAAITDQAGGDAFDEGVFRQAINWAVGATERRGSDFVGGIGEWNGSRIWLPPRISQADFSARMARASGQQLVGAAVNDRGQPTGAAPRYLGADGKPGRALKASEFKQLDFETVSPGVYRVKGPLGGVLIDDRGRPWLFDARRLP